jgi:hypothetical protein
MIGKGIILAVFLAIVLCLFSALRHFLNITPADREGLYRALLLRVSLAVVLLIGMIVAVLQGWITLHVFGA